MIRKIIENEMIEMHLQPIVSIKTKKIYGYEALVRANFNGDLINPFVLFSLAKEEGLILELDMLARKKAISKFKEYYEKDNSLILFLNFESSMIDNFDVNSLEYSFDHQIKELGIPSSNFVLEVKEDEIKSEERLISFCRYYRDLGYNIAVDDFGTGSSNYERLIHIKPNILKIDRSLFDNIENDYIKKSIVNSLVILCNDLGITLLAEGLENKESIHICMSLDISLFQGYYFLKPKKDIEKKDEDEIFEKVLEIGQFFKDKTLKKIKKNRELKNRLNRFSERIIDKIIDMNSSQNIIKKVHKEFNEIEAIYLIDADSSKQIHDTVISNVNNGHFFPTKNGHEHLLKEYYYITLESKEGIYLSEKYLSSATGNSCKTFAKLFYKHDKKYILCLDVLLNTK